MEGFFFPCNSSGVAMDPRIWRRLPQPLIDRILAFLPPAAFFRARSVCRRWYALLFSTYFLDLHDHLSPRVPFFLFFLLPSFPSSLHSTSTTTAVLLDTKINTWHPIPFDHFIPDGFTPAASHGGVVCWISDAAGSKTLLLSNPLSKLVAHLPPSRCARLWPTVGLAIGHSSITAIIAGDDMITPFSVMNISSERFTTDVSSGFCSPWTMVSALPRLSDMKTGRMLFADERFYCMSFGPFAVLAYNPDENEWSKIKPPMQKYLRSPSLVVCWGRIMLVAAVEKAKLSIPQSVRVWELRGCRRTWEEIGRMPMDIYRQFAEAERGRGFECTGNGVLIAVTMCGSVDVLLFDLERKQWRWVPRCPLTAHGGEMWLRGMSYEPQLGTPLIGSFCSTASVIANL